MQLYTVLTALNMKEPHLSHTVDVLLAMDYNLDALLLGRVSHENLNQLPLAIGARVRVLSLCPQSGFVIPLNLSSSQPLVDMTEVMQIIIDELRREEEKRISEMEELKKEFENSKEMLAKMNKEREEEDIRRKEEEERRAIELETLRKELSDAKERLEGIKEKDEEEKKVP